MLRPVPAGARMVYPRIGGSGAPRALPLAPHQPGSSLSCEAVHSTRARSLLVHHAGATILYNVIIDLVARRAARRARGPRPSSRARTLHPLPRCSHAPLCPDSTTASAEKRRGRRDGSAHRAGRLSRRVMAMTIRAEIRRSVGLEQRNAAPSRAASTRLAGSARPS
eukprot:COSAG06_NODE_16773_length_981_cov_3.106576_1_plen_166_part_00